MKASILALTFVLSAAVAPAALAAPSIDTAVELTISVAQYNLRNEAGANAAYAHVRREVRNACRVSPGRTTIRFQLAEETCVVGMTNQAVSKTGSSVPTQIHLTRTHQS
ncbi:MAG: UrcA family protein [Alphaproteobacteria bacterium]|nr:UrcA family protein [Alphaproteobacteria bacterium]